MIVCELYLNKQNIIISMQVEPQQGQGFLECSIWSQGLRDQGLLITDSASVISIPPLPPPPSQEWKKILAEDRADAFHNVFLLITNYDERERYKVPLWKKEVVHVTEF